MNSSSSELALAPLGAGDLIDRAVRLYRQHFLTLIRIAAPPVLLSAQGYYYRVPRAGFYGSSALVCG